MKVILFFYVISYLVCNIHYLKKYESTNSIDPRVDNYGLVVLDISDFTEEEPIYIYYNTYEGNYTNSIRYAFSNYSINSVSDIKLESTKKTYMTRSIIHKHNISDGRGGYTVYYNYEYGYYYKFKRPDNISEFLALEYSLAGYWMNYILVSNIKDKDETDESKDDEDHVLSNSYSYPIRHIFININSWSYFLFP